MDIENEPPRPTRNNAKHKGTKRSNKKIIVKQSKHTHQPSGSILQTLVFSPNGPPVTTTLENYLECVSDCNECLKLKPNF